MGEEDLDDQVLQDLTAIAVATTLLLQIPWEEAGPEGQLPRSHLVTALTSEPVGSNHGSAGQVASKEVA